MISKLIEYFPIAFRAALAKICGIPFVLAQAGLPIGTPSSGTIGDNGALSGLTAFSTTYSGGVYLYFPAGKIFAGSLANHYYCVMTSTTDGTIYNNTYTNGIPAIPASPTPFVSTGPGAYTQAVTGITTLSFPDIIPAGFLGLNGGLEIVPLWSSPTTANAKTVSIKFGGSAVFSVNLTTGSWYSKLVDVFNMGVANRQISTNWLFGGTTSNPYLNTSIDTTVNQSISVTNQLTVATEYLILEAFKLKVLPS